MKMKISEIPDLDCTDIDAEEARGIAFANSEEGKIFDRIMNRVLFTARMGKYKMGIYVNTKSHKGNDVLEKVCESFRARGYMIEQDLDDKTYSGHVRIDVDFHDL